MNIISQYEPLIGYSEKEAMAEYMNNPGFLTEYKKTEEFEKQITNTIGVKYCSVVNNGTISLSLGLIALGIKPGDKVIVPDITMIATINAVKFIGAIPVLCDVNENILLDLDKAVTLIRNDSEIRAVIIVSLNGRAHLSEIYGFKAICDEHKVKVLGDDAQSFGSKNYEDKFIGTCVSDISSFSFSMPKIITTGQGGALISQDANLAQTIKKLKDFGRSSGGNDKHDYFGINSKFTEMQAVIGIEQLKDIKYRIQRKKELYSLYYNELKDVSSVKFINYNVPCWTPWFVDVFVKDKQELQQYLKDKGIGSRSIYPAIHTQAVYPEYNDMYFPKSSRLADTGLWLPSSFTLTDSDVIYICESIKEFYHV